MSDYVERIKRYCDAAGMEPGEPLRLMLMTTCEAAESVERAAAALSDPSALAKLEQAAVTGADRRMMRAAREHNWRTLAIAAAAGVGLLLGGVVGGWTMFSKTGIQSCLTYGHVATDKAGRAYCWASFYLVPPDSGTTTVTRLVNPP